MFALICWCFDPNFKPVENEQDRNQYRHLKKIRRLINNEYALVNFNYFFTIIYTSKYIYLFLEICGASVRWIAIFLFSFLPPQHLFIIILKRWRVRPRKM